MDLADACFAGAAAQADLLRAGELSSRELVDATLRRIERHDRELNAYRLVFAEQALEHAAAADERRSRGEDAPLLGVPIAVKEDSASTDSSRSADGCRCTRPASCGRAWSWPGR